MIFTAGRRMMHYPEPTDRPRASSAMPIRLRRCGLAVGSSPMGPPKFKTRLLTRSYHLTMESAVNR